MLLLFAVLFLDDLGFGERLLEAVEAVDPLRDQAVVDAVRDVHVEVLAVDDAGAGTHHQPQRAVQVVLAFGVLWEVLEFAIAITADALGTDPILTQYGLTDTLWDLVFDTLGAIVVATWGSAHLNDVSGYLRERMERRAAEARRALSA